MEKIKVVVAEKDSSLLYTIGQLLDREKYQLFICESDEQLISWPNEIDINLAIIDFEFSNNLDGYALLKLIRGLRPQLEIITLLPSFTQLDDSKLLSLAPICPVIKSFEREKFISVCERVHSQMLLKSIWPKIISLVEDFLQNYLKQDLKADVQKMLPNISQEIIRKELAKI